MSFLYAGRSKTAGLLIRKHISGGICNPFIAKTGLSHFVP
jgi:hypothetical protein